MSVSPNVLVYEYFTGGGFPDGDLPDGLAAESLGMLWALLDDFHTWGAVHTVSALDLRFENRIPGLNRATLPADEVVPVTPQEHKAVFLSLLERCDAALIIAPETDGILSRLSAQVESAGKTLLGSSSAAIDLAGNKEAFSRIMDGANLPTPATRVAGFDSVESALSESGLPLVLKSLDGIGSEGVCLISDPADIPEALDVIRRATSLEKFIIQSFVEGIHASVSLLTVEGRSLPLSMNRQLIHTGIPFEYQGGMVPFHSERAEYATDLACKAVSQIPGLLGYVGVDIVISGDFVQLIEINPRLTTSYIGLRQVARMNPARMIFEACTLGITVDSFPMSEPVIVRKDDPGSWGLQIEDFQF